jgi:uncharacterized protein (TIGR03083 family)
MDEGIDYLAVIEAEAARSWAALDAAPTARIPWSDAWTVRECAQHLASTHRFGEGVVAGRPAAEWEVRAAVDPPPADSPDLPAWVAASSASLLDRLRSTDPSERCWSWWPEASDVAFWRRRMAQETLVHRWDLELGAGIDGPPMDPVVAADGVDEALDVFVGMSRFLHAAPGAGETFHLHCTDTDGEWLLTCTAEGERTLRREHAKGDVAYRGRAEDLLLFVWGRRGPEDAGIEVLGDPAVHARWAELVPSM